MTNPNSYYDFSKPNVSLGDGEIEARIQGEEYTGKGEAILKFVPSPSIEIVGILEMVSPANSQSKITNLSFNGTAIDGIQCLFGGWKAGYTPLRWSVHNEQIISSNCNISRIDFGVLNFLELDKNRFNLTYNDWVVEIFPADSIKSIFDDLTANGGYKLTHLAQVSKVDNSEFSESDCLNFVSNLKLFLSFAKGSWCWPICPIGINANNDKTWKMWNAPREPWWCSTTWCTGFDQITSLFPGFMKKCEECPEIMQSILYWHMLANNSNSLGIDASIILTQVALERISFEYIVNVNAILTKSQFENSYKNAFNKIEFFLNNIEVNIEVPAEASELNALSHQWQNGLEGFTRIRNALVHPKSNRRGQYENAYLEAWHLGLMFLEKSILKFCGYSGGYLNRISNTIEQIQ